MRVSRSLAAATAVTILASFPAFAGGLFLEGLTRADAGFEGPATQTVEEVLAPGQAARTPLNITSEGPSEAALVLGVANSAGRYNSYFTTDLFLVNPHPDGMLKINVFALLPDRDNVANVPPNGSLTLPARSWAILKNVLGQMGVSGTGAALLLGVDSSLSTGAVKTVSAWAYTSTPAPAGGRYGVNIHGIGNTYLDSLFDGWCVGVNVGNASRTNIGVFNASSTRTLSVSARVYSFSGTLLATIPFAVPPVSFSQVAVDSYAAAVNDGVVWFDGASGPYAAYMVVNDNFTNDANFQLATGW